MVNEEWGRIGSSFGQVAVVTRSERICRIHFKDSVDNLLFALDKFYPQSKESSSTLISSGLKQLDEYFLGKRFRFDLLLDNSELSPFARDVQKALLSLSYGATVTYSGLASKAGFPGAARAVGTVMSSNPFPLLVPCHRVVNANGDLGSYSAAFGASTKIQLINLEQKYSKE